MVTGESGSGKTSACRNMVASLHAGLYRARPSSFSMQRSASRWGLCSQQCAKLCTDIAIKYIYNKN
jgi:type II secretory pathway predicted ATPase ExeA